MQRILGAILGALATFVALLIMDATRGDASPKYGVAVIIGAVISVFYPWVIAFILARRAKSRRANQVDRQVDRRLAEEQSKKG
jgi:ABC-type Fe3+-siderophore transport system permease subunit